MFSPAEADAERQAERRAERKSANDPIAGGSAAKGRRPAQAEGPLHSRQLSTGDYASVHAGKRPRVASAPVTAHCGDRVTADIRCRGGTDHPGDTLSLDATEIYAEADVQRAHQIAFEVG